MIAFTIANLNYLDKVIALSRSAKIDKNIKFIWIAVESKDRIQDLKFSEFYKIFSIEELQIPNFTNWIFKYNVVEACTAVKADSFIFIANQYPAEKIVYLDPDMQIISPLEEIEPALEKSPVLITPHLTEPEKTTEGIEINELDALKHGIFNLGFLAIKPNSQSLEFLTWWRSRLRDYSFDDKERGLFTDQKWINLAIGFFDYIKIFRNEGYNVATWNISNRKLSKNNNQLVVNGTNLRLLHFSGYDSGAHHGMMKKFAKHNSIFLKLSKKYTKELKEISKDLSIDKSWSYGFFSNGEEISNVHRKNFNESKFRNHENPFSLNSQHFCETVYTKPNQPGLAIIARDDKANLKKKYIFNESNYLKQINSILDDKKIVLSITHGFGGGVQIAVDRINERLRKKYNLITLKNLDKFGNKKNIVLSVDSQKNTIDFIIPREVFFSWIKNRKLKINFLAVHHVIFQEEFVKKLNFMLRIPKVLFIHDYYLFNPFWNLVGTTDQKGSLPLSEQEFTLYLKNPQYSQLLERWGSPNDWLKFASSFNHIFIPSESVREQLVNIPTLKSKLVKYQLPDHQILKIKSIRRKPKRSKIRVCVMGDLNTHKGADTIDSVITFGSNILEFALLGKTTLDKKKFNICIDNYSSDDYLEKLTTIDPDIIWLPTMVEETYSFTFSEALTYDAVIVTSDIRVFAERGKSYNNVLVYPKNSTPREWQNYLIHAIQSFNSRLD